MTEVYSTFWFWILILGVVLLIAAGISYAVKKKMETWIWVLLAAAVILIILSIIIGIVQKSKYDKMLESSAVLYQRAPRRPSQPQTITTHKTESSQIVAVPNPPGFRQQVPTPVQQIQFQQPVIQQPIRQPVIQQPVIQPDQRINQPQIASLTYSPDPISPINRSLDDATSFTSTLKHQSMNNLPVSPSGLSSSETAGLSPSGLSSSETAGLSPSGLSSSETGSNTLIAKGYSFSSVMPRSS